MYGIKRIVFDEFKQAREIEFYEGVSHQDICRALEELQLIPKLTIRKVDDSPLSNMTTKQAQDILDRWNES